MGLLDQKTSHVVDLEVLPDNTEAQFQIVEADTRVSDKTGREFISGSVELPDHPAVGLVYFTVMGIKEDDEPRKADTMLRRLRIFKQAVGLEPDDQINLDNLIGQTGFAVFGVEDTDTGKRNVIKRFSVSQAN